MRTKQLSFFAALRLESERRQSPRVAETREAIAGKIRAALLRDRYLREQAQRFCLREASRS